MEGLARLEPSGKRKGLVGIINTSVHIQSLYAYGTRNTETFWELQYEECGFGQGLLKVSKRSFSELL